MRPPLWSDSILPALNAEFVGLRAHVQRSVRRAFESLCRRTRVVTGHRAGLFCTATPSRSASWIGWSGAARRAGSADDAKVAVADQRRNAGADGFLAVPSSAAKVLCAG